MKNVIIKKSKIHGKGVFAKRNFKKGEVVIKWSPKMISKNKLKKLSKKQKNYVNRHKGKIILMQSPEKYVNHSSNPNTKSKNFCDIAINNIKKGEEITSKYLKK